MMDFLKSFKSLIKIEQIRTDNNVFRLHYKLTVIMLIVFSILLTSKQYFGDPIECQVSDNKDFKDLVETYCWIYGTYVVKHTLADEAKGIPGLGPDPHRVAPWIRQIEQGPNDEIIWHKYYQWVCIVFCFQALLFYLPRYLWKTWEGGRLRQLVNDLNTPLVTNAWNQTTKSQLIQYLTCGKYMNNLYALRYSICEVFNLINVIVQIFLMDWFLGGQFSFYGLAMLSSQEINPMTQAFPKLTKCQFWKFGHSGTLENRDALCVLSLNVLNEKLFLVLWFWLFILSIITLLSLVYRFCVILFPKLRIYLLMAQARYIGNRQASLIINRLKYGDFFLLYHVGKNVNPIIFRELVSGIYESLKTKSPYIYPGIEANSI